MKKITKFLALILSVIACLSSVGCNGCGSKLENVINLGDNGEVLTNPDMGFNFTYYANTIYDFNNNLLEGDYLDDFPCPTVFFRIGWNWIEPVEGQFNWEFTDKIARDWIAHGKRIAFCWVATFPGDQSTPLWVKDAGAQGVQYKWALKNSTDQYPTLMTEQGFGNLEFNHIPVDAQEYALNRGIRNDGGQEVSVGDYENYRATWVANYDDAVFIQKLDNFLKAAAERYDSPDSEFFGKVEFIEIGSFGDWGEGHSSYTVGNRATAATRKKHIDLYLKYFKNVQLMVNDDAANTLDLLEYARDNGIGMSDHSIQVSDSNYPEEGRPGNSDAASVVYETQPVLLEEHNGREFLETYYNSVIDCHATYARINVNPYMADAAKFKDKIALKLGYRLVFNQVKFSQIKAGKTLKFEFKIKNDGAAPCYGGGNPTFKIVDETFGRTRATAVSSLDVKDLIVADTLTLRKAVEATGTAEVKLPDSLPKGTYYIVLSVAKDGVDTYNLPLDHKDEDNLRYKIATFTVK
ncbi:MAG: DUF4832 domain-containing protein [Clostridiales bacterium]|nr:DUF4832 domain-containing protein [Clostridiales bacterium]